MGSDDTAADPRIYMAAERTWLAWIRTGIALMAFGFVVARFGVFLRQIAVPSADAAEPAPGTLYIGLALIGLGVLMCAVSAVRHRRYVQAIDEGRFRAEFGSRLAFGVVLILALIGIAMAVILMTL
ncbi:MAG: YidH family protein [Candidatus Binatia bacterium]